MTTFFERFPARRNGTVHSGLILELSHSELFLELKEKFAGAGGIKGRLPRVYLTRCHQKRGVKFSVVFVTVRFWIVLNVFGAKVESNFAFSAKAWS